MIELENPGSTDLLLRPPSPSYDGFAWHHGLIDDTAPTTTYVLENSRAKFTFTADEIGGAYLSSFERKGAGAHAWTNLERSLWRARVFDTQASTHLAVGEICPLWHDLSTAGVVVDSDTGDQTLTLTWTDALVWNTDTLTVTLVLCLKHSDDWITASISAEWSGSASRYALDHLAVLPLKIRPWQAPDDVAVQAVQKGVMVSDPVAKLIASPRDGVTSVLPFGSSYINFQCYPQGRGQEMPLWGYYNTADLEGWMVWLENHTGEISFNVFQSDGNNLSLEIIIPQGELLKPHNGSQTLGSSYNFCLRPFLATSTHGWWDIGEQYRLRLEATQPYFYVPKRVEDSSLDPLEKTPFAWVQVAHLEYPFSDTLLIDRLEQLREKIGGDESYPIFGNCSFNHGSTHPINVFNKPNGDARQALLKARGHNFFLGIHQFGQFLPYVNDIRKWPDTTDVWRDKDLLHGYRMSRRGRWEGGGDTRIGEHFNQYFYEDLYTVVSYNPTSGDMVITPPLVRSTLGQRSISVVARRTNGNGVVSILEGDLEVGPVAGATALSFSNDFINGDYMPDNPTLGDELAIYGDGDPCYHAIINTTNYFDWVKKYTWGGYFEVLGTGCYYLDVETSRILAGFANNHESVPCCGDHATWTELDNYTPHPQGGGEWIGQARRTFFGGVVDYVRARSRAAKGLATSFFHAECQDESFLGLLQADLQGSSNGASWRSFTSATADRVDFQMCPLFATVHAGRTFTFMFNEGMSNALLRPDIRNGTRVSDAYSKAYIRAVGAWLGSDWPFGLTLPHFIHYMDSSATGPTDYDLWDDAQYAADHPLGAADPEIAQLRDMYVSIMKFEKNFLFDYLRNGDMLPPPVLESGTTYTTGLHNLILDVYGDPVDTELYYTVPLLYPKSSYPSITSAAWRSRSHARVCVVMSNWTHEEAVHSATYDMAQFGLPTNRPVAVFQVQENGCPALITTFTGATITLDTTLAAYTVGALLFVEEADTVYVKPEVTNLKVTPTFVEGELKVTWSMPAPVTGAASRYSYPKVGKVILVRKQSGYPRNHLDGVVVYEGTATEFTDTQLQGGQPYHYAAFVDDYGVVTTT